MTVLNQRQRKFVLPGFKGPVSLQDIVDTAIAGGSGGGGEGGDGVSVTGAIINGEGDLIITLSNGQTLNAGQARGEDGADGEPGTPGTVLSIMPLQEGIDGVSNTGRSINAARLKAIIEAHAPTGGGGSSKPWYFAPPLAADFTLASGDANNLTLADDADVGLMVKSGPLASGSDISRIAWKPIPTPGSNWDLVVHNQVFVDSQDYTKAQPLLLRDSVSGRMATMAVTNEYNTYANVNFNSLIAYGGATGSGFENKGGAPQWFRVNLTGTTLTYFVSLDGKNWLDVASAAVTSFLTNRPNQVGFGVCMNKTTGKKVTMTIDHFSLVQ